MAETKANAETAFDRFVTNYGGKYPKATEWPGEGSRGVARVLRVSGRALDSHSQQQRHRVELRHHSAPDRPHQGLSDARRDARHDLQARAIRRAQLATTARLRMARESRRGCQVQRWDRSEDGNARQTEESTQQGRRLINSRTPDLTISPRRNLEVMKFGL